VSGIARRVRLIIRKQIEVSCFFFFLSSSHEKSSRKETNELVNSRKIKKRNNNLSKEENYLLFLKCEIPHRLSGTKEIGVKVDRGFFGLKF
jgi:hypothetical protein